MNRFTGTWTLVRLILRCDRVRLPIWLLALVGLVGASAAGVQGIYDTAASRASYARTAGGSAASIALSGPPVALDTIGGITVFEVSQVAVVGVSLMAVFLTVRHTRTEEQAGRTELLRAGVLGRHADLAAICVVMSGASVLVGVGTLLTFVGVGLPTTGSLAYAAAVTTLGLVFTGVALVAAQVSQHSRGATGLSLAVLGLLYGLRAIGDVEGSWVTWASPIGWAQAVRPFADERWWPLGLALGFAAGTAALAGWLAGRRDLGAGLVADRPGRARASRRLGSPLGLAARLQRAAVIGWAVGMGALGAVYGSFGQDVQSMLDDNPEMADYFRQVAGEAAVTDAYFSVVVVFNAIIATGFTISSVLRLRTEESDLHTEPALATSVSRTRWALSWLAVTVLGSVLVVGTAGLLAGVVWAATSSDPGQVAALTAAQLSYLPAVLLLGALTFLVYGWQPHLAGAAYAALGVCFVIGWLGDLLRLPDWAMGISPFERTPLVPSVGYDAVPLVVMTAMAVTLAVVGERGFRRRDLLGG
ncbi:hypothetical protein GGQ22_15790 [Nocardioides sp. zg-579]|uniref:ABC transporter permease n=1 Tax=Nocardioides marmotae TaxID=2663857 RepID=A0A6I3JEK0_9ACTN|nr:hypothetical protein [Nocardioides marmotae]MCR6032887.1 hypothetical protein [Gordonia jinghuaiqii]MTB96537.1 hypothetical protein [Nocardioides marmotae]QKE01942.1 hypothetical protein HPC71_13340 [Nocardioides marmotae]